MRFGTAMHFRRILDYYERRDFIFLNIQNRWKNTGFRADLIFRVEEPSAFKLVENIRIKITIFRFFSKFCQQV